MIVIPAIDLRGGRCVRLLQGDFAKETVFGNDPAAMARRWRDAGARWLHVVDLDGARAGGPRQVEAIAAIVAAVDMPVQVGGGIRTAEDAAQLLGAGVERVVIGTAAVEKPQLLDVLIERYGSERIVVGVDARNGWVATRGWLTTTDMLAGELITALAKRGVTRVAYTDIERDGTLTSPNFEALAAVTHTGMRVIASGGVTRRTDLKRLSEILGVEAAIVGRALYTGDLRLGSAEWEIGAPASADVR